MVYSDDKEWVEVRVEKKVEKERRTEAGAAKRSRVVFEAKVMYKTRVTWKLGLDQDAYGTTDLPGNWVAVEKVVPRPLFFWPILANFQ